MGAPATLAPLRPVLANGAPSIPESERPAGGILLKPRAWFSSHAPRAYPLRARVGGGSAERAEGRSEGAARAGKRARRSGAQPGALTEVVGMSDELLTVPEVMSRLKVGRTTVYDLIRTRRLPSLTIGSSRRIPADGLRAFLASRLEKAA